MRAIDTDFLTEHPCPRPISIVAAGRVWVATLFLGHGRLPLEIVAVAGDRQLTNAELVAAWKDRKAQRAAAVVLIWLHSDGESLGATLVLDAGKVIRCPPGMAERVASMALSAPDRHAALAVIRQYLAILCY